MSAQARRAERRRGQRWREEAERPFDLGRGRCCGRCWCGWGERAHVLIVMLHHIICDGWSLGVLLRELAALYEAYAAGQASPLAALAMQYGDYAVWQREWLQGAGWTSSWATGGSGWGGARCWSCRRTGRGRRWRADRGGDDRGGS